MKIVHEKVNELHDEFDKIEAKKKGKWIDLYYTVENDRVAVKVTGLTRGQAWGLKRTAQNRGLRVRLTDNSTTAILLPPEE